MIPRVWYKNRSKWRHFVVAAVFFVILKLSVSSSVCVSVRESLSLYVFDLIMKHMSIFYVLQDIKQRFKRVSLARNEAEWTLLITVCQTNNIFDGGQAVR